MHDEHSNSVLTEQSEKQGYEESDVSIPVLLKYLFFLVVFVAVTSVLVLGLYAVFVPQLLKPTDKNYVVSDAERRIPPAGIPQVQPDPIKDIKKFRAEEAVRTGQDGITGHGYGTWKDGDGNEVTYIPLARAMEIVETKGFKIESPDDTKNDVTPPAVDRGFVDNPLPDGTQPSVQGKVGKENGDSMDESSYAHHTPGM